VCAPRTPVHRLQRAARQSQAARKHNAAIYGTASRVELKRPSAEMSRAEGPSRARYTGTARHNELPQRLAEEMTSQIDPRGARSSFFCGSCPVRVISGHLHCDSPCPLYPPERGHQTAHFACRLRTRNGLMHRSKKKDRREAVSPKSEQVFQSGSWF
jgi:hypothetical protein